MCLELLNVICIVYLMKFTKITSKIVLILFRIFKMSKSSALSLYKVMLKEANRLFFIRDPW